jgi:predicted alpha/beta-hydrolase family hydrolase
MSGPTEIELPTAHGPARAYIHEAEQPKAALVLGHGAGGGVGSPDLVAATEAAVPLGVTVALVEQPYRVAGRRSQGPAPKLDEAWIAVVEQLRAGPLAGLPLIVGGRSAGARVACRTVTATDPVGVLCLAFPVHPPGKGDDPDKSRLPELDAVKVPTLVVQGEADPFGMPPPKGRNRKVAKVPGTHSLRNADAVQAAVSEWLATRLRQRAGS